MKTLKSKCFMSFVISILVIGLLIGFYSINLKDDTNNENLGSVIKSSEKNEVVDETKEEDIINHKKETDYTEIGKEEIKEQIVEEDNSAIKTPEVPKSDSSNDNHIIETPILQKVPKEEVVPENSIDLEYEKEFAKVEYSDFDVCHQAGINKVLSDTATMSSFSCRDVYYGGKIIGYRLVIYYVEDSE